MDAFSPIPDHTGFKARNLFADGQQILKGGAFAKIAPGGGGPLSPHRHAHAHLFIVTRGTVSVMLDGKERTVHEYESQLGSRAAFCTPSGTKIRNRRKFWA